MPENKTQNWTDRLMQNDTHVYTCVMMDGLFEVVVRQNNLPARGPISYTLSAHRMDPANKKICIATIAQHSTTYNDLNKAKIDALKLASDALENELQRINSEHAQVQQALLQLQTTAE